MALRITLLGAFGISDGDGTPIPIGARKQRALLAYLAVPPGRARSRTELAGLLWGRRDDAHARHSLNQALTGIRAALGPHGAALLSQTETVSLDPAAVDTDLGRFERLVRSGGPAELAGAAELCRGDLLAGLETGVPAFEDWQLAARYALREQAGEVFRRLVALEAERGRIEAAVAAGRRLVELFPLDEDAHVSLMRLFARQGRGELVATQYRRCRDLLQQELAVRPAATTEEAYRAALADARSGSRTERAPRDAAAWPSRIRLRPFENRSADPTLDAIAEGIADDLRVELGRFRSLVVTTMPGHDAADGAAAPYELRGALRRVDGRLRIHAELLDLPQRRSLWIERYDVEATSILSAPEAFCRRIAATAAGRVELAAREHAMRKPSSELAAADLCLLGIEHHQRFSVGDHARSRQLLEQAIALDPGLSLAHAWLALVHLGAAFGTPPELRRRALADALSAAERATQLDGEQNRCQVIRGWVELQARRFEEAEAIATQGMLLNPGDGHGLSHLGVLLGAIGRPAEGERLIRAAIEQNPYHPRWYWQHLAVPLLAQERHVEAADAVRRGGGTPLIRHALGAAAHALADQPEAARRHVDALLATQPAASATLLVEAVAYRSEADRGRFLDGLRRAGLPA